MLEFHPLANLFPLIEDQDFAELVADIKTNGVREWIVMHEGAILDGRNRWRAAVAAKIYPDDFDPYYKDKNGERAALKSGFRKLIPADGDPLAFVLSKNLHRRHLDESQRAMVAAKLASLSRGRPGENPPDGGISAAAAARMLNVGERSIERARIVEREGVPELKRAVERGEITVSAAASVASQPEEVQRRLVEVDSPAFHAEVKRIRQAKQDQKKARRQEREHELGTRQQALPNKKYGVIYEDPAWQFIVRSTETGMDRAPENHYPTMTLDEIFALPVGDLAAADCVYFLWVTNPFLQEGMALLNHRGFEYKSNYAWGKDKIGPGYWNREKHELLLIGTRGNVPCPAPGTQWDSLQIVPRGDHSAKPDRFADMIEAYFPSLPKIELNRRGLPRPGWDAWGNEAELPPHDPETGEIIEDPEAKASEVEPGTAGGSASVRRSTTGQGLQVGVAGTRMPVEEGDPSPSCNSAEGDIDLPPWLDRSNWIDGHPPARAAASIMSIEEAAHG